MNTTTQQTTTTVKLADRLVELGAVSHQAAFQWLDRHVELFLEPEHHAPGSGGRREWTTSQADQAVLMWSILERGLAGPRVARLLARDLIEMKFEPGDVWWFDIDDDDNTQWELFENQECGPGSWIVQPHKILSACGVTPCK